jgi:hypothetical protein
MAGAKRKGVSDDADPRFVPVIAALEKAAGFSLMESQSRATRGLRRDGKSFGMSFHGRFILKMNEERAAALIGEGLGKPFSPARGKVLRGWLEIISPSADWIALAKEAYALASPAEENRSAKRVKRESV